MYRAIKDNIHTRWFVFVGDARRAGDRRFGAGNWTMEVKRNNKDADAYSSDSSL